MVLFWKKKPAVDLKKAEAVLADNKVFSFVGSGDPHEQLGKVRVFLKTLAQVKTDLLVFDGDFLEEPAYLRADKDINQITLDSVKALGQLHSNLLDAKLPTLLAAGNYEIFGTTTEAIHDLGSDQLFDIGCNKKAPQKEIMIFEKPVYMDLVTQRTTWPGNVFDLEGFTLIGAEGSNPINYTFPGERTEENMGWALETPWSKISPQSEKTILVVHSPPYGIRDRLGRFGVPPHLWGARKGSTGLRKFLDRKRPFLTLVGHIHEDFGINIRAWPKDDKEAELKETDITFRNRIKLLIGYDSKQTELSIVLNKGTLEYWNWSHITIAEQGTLRLIDVEGEWMNRKGKKKSFKKYNQIIDYDDTISAFFS